MSSAAPYACFKELQSMADMPNTTVGLTILAFSGEHPPERSEERRSSAATPCYPAPRAELKKGWQTIAKRASWSGEGNMISR